MALQGLCSPESARQTRDLTLLVSGTVESLKMALKRANAWLPSASWVLSFHGCLLDS